MYVWRWHGRRIFSFIDKNATSQIARRDYHRSDSFNLICSRFYFGCIRSFCRHWLLVHSDVRKMRLLDVCCCRHSARQTLDRQFRDKRTHDSHHCLVDTISNSIFCLPINIITLIISFLTHFNSNRWRHGGLWLPEIHRYVDEGVVLANTEHHAKTSALLWRHN